MINYGRGWALCSPGVLTELATHPDVLEASVIARPHPRWGERPMAFVILQPAAVKKWSRRHDDFEKDLKAHTKVTNDSSVSVVPLLHF